MGQGLGKGGAQPQFGGGCGWLLFWRRRGGPQAGPLTSRPPPAPRPRPAPADLAVQGLGSGAVAEKPPGSLGTRFGPGVPLEIADCHGSVVGVLDWTEQITVDACDDCVFLLGPTAGSVFLRGCRDCVVVVAGAQQLRLRDCVRCVLRLHVATQPIIESSSQIDFGPSRLAYPAWADQCAAAQLHLLQNRWNHVYDFTPGVSESAAHAIVRKGDESDAPATLSRIRTALGALTAANQAIWADAQLIAAPVPLNVAFSAGSGPVSGSVLVFRVPAASDEALLASALVAGGVSVLEARVSAIASLPGTLKALCSKDAAPRAVLVIAGLQGGTESDARLLAGNAGHLLDVLVADGGSLGADLRTFFV